MVFYGSENVLTAPIEVLSQAAMSYFAVNAEQCVKRIPHADKGESQYLSKCLESLMISAEPEPDLLLTVDPYSASSTSACDNTHAAFHPFKAWPTSLQCLEQTGRRIFREPQRLQNPVRAPSMYCFTLVRPTTYEAVLVAQQYLEGVGIFAC